jgi:hypothetical protein
MDARDWWALANIVAVLLFVAVVVALLPCATRLAKRMDELTTIQRQRIDEDIRTRQVVEKYWRDVVWARDDMADAEKLRQDVLDSLTPPTERSA